MAGGNFSYFLESESNGFNQLESQTVFIKNYGRGIREEKQNHVKSINASLTNYIKVIMQLTSWGFQSRRNLQMSICIFIDGAEHNEEETPALFYTAWSESWTLREDL